MSFQKEPLRLIRAYAVIFIMSGWKGGKKVFPFFFSITCSQRVIRVNLENWFFRAIGSQGSGCVLVTDASRSGGCCLWADLGRLSRATAACDTPFFRPGSCSLVGWCFSCRIFLFLSTRFFFVKAVDLFLPSSFSSVGTSAVLRVNIAVFNSVVFCGGRRAHEYFLTTCRLKKIGGRWEKRGTV